MVHGGLPMSFNARKAVIGAVTFLAFFFAIVMAITVAVIIIASVDWGAVGTNWPLFVLFSAFLISVFLASGFRGGKKE